MCVCVCVHALLQILDLFGGSACAVLFARGNAAVVPIVHNIIVCGADRTTKGVSKFLRAQWNRPRALKTLFIIARVVIHHHHSFDPVYVYKYIYVYLIIRICPRALRNIVFSRIACVLRACRDTETRENGEKNGKISGKVTGARHPNGKVPAWVYGLAVFSRKKIHRPECAMRPTEKCVRISRSLKEKTRIF